MKVSIGLSSKRFVVPLIILLLFSSALALGDDERKNEIAGYVSGYFCIGDGAESYLSFDMGYERRLNDWISFAVLVGYVPLMWDYNLASSARVNFKKSLGGSKNFTSVSKVGSELDLYFGLYFYLLRQRDKRYDLFLYLGNSYYRWSESHKAYSDDSSRTEALSNSDSFFSPLDMGVGLRYRFSKRHFLRGEWRLGNVLSGEEQIWKLLLGLSYRF